MPHIHELIDFTVNAFIVYNNKVLLIRHIGLQKWLPVGGHVELDEDLDEALYREAKEESGLDIEIIATKPNIVSEGVKFLHTPAYVDIHQISSVPGHRHIAFNYFATAKTDIVTLAEREHTDIRWFTLEEIADPKYGITPAIQFYAEQALASAI